jgi:hypothetical protein
MDPIILPAADGLGDFARSLRISGDLIACSAPNEGSAGEIYIYRRQSHEVWTLIQTIDGAIDSSSVDTGWTLDIDGDWLAAWDASFNDTAIGDRVHLWKRNATTGQFEFKQTIDEPGGGFNYFGYSIAIDGDRMAVGRPFGSTGNAYVYLRTGDTWALEDTVTDGLNDELGYCVALSGDTLVVGASDGGNGKNGHILVYTRSGSSWSEEQDIDNAHASAFAYGQAVAVDGDTLVAGDQGPGYVDVWVRSGTTWTKQQQLIATPPSTDFGSGVAIYGDTIVAVDQHSTSPSDGGSVHQFVRSGSVWTEDFYWVAPYTVWFLGHHPRNVDIATDGSFVVGKQGNTSTPTLKAYVWDAPYPDFDPPEVENEDPAPGETFVDPFTDIVLDVVDRGDEDLDLRMLAGANSADLAIFDGVWGTMPVTASGSNTWSISGTGQDDIWVGSLRSNAQYIDHWDGFSWKSYLLRNDAGSTSELTVHAPFPGVCFAGYNQGTSSSVRFFRYDSGSDTFVDLGSSVNWSGGAVPLVISATLCYFSINGSGGAFPSFRRWDTGVWSTHPTGLGLPDGGMNGIILHQGEIFIHKGSQGIYRGQWGGPWTLDSPSVSIGWNASQNHSIATDGDRIAVGDSTGRVWIREGPNDYTDLGLSGVSGAEGQIAISGDNIIRDGGNTCQHWNGTSWSLIPNADSNGAWALNENFAPAPTGVDPDTVVLKINGLTVWENDGAVNGWSGSKVAVELGYRYTLNNPGSFTRGSTVQVSVDACDLIGNCIA